MDYASAKDYVVEFISVLNAYKNDYFHNIKELKKWAVRIKLARKDERDSLLNEAEKIFAKLTIKSERLKNECKILEMHADMLKQQLKRKNQYSVLENDADLLLNKLETILNKSSEDMEVEEKLKDITLQSKLEALKKKMLGDNKS